MLIKKYKKYIEADNDSLVITEFDRVFPNVFPFCGSFYETLDNVKKILENIRWYKIVYVPEKMTFTESFQKTLFNKMIEEIKKNA